MTEKDYSLLRPFDLEAAKDGAEICYELGCPTEFIGVLNQDKPGYVLTKDQNHVLFSSTNRKILRLSPLCWVEGKPVYPDTPMEREDNGWPVKWSVDGSAWLDDAGNWSDERDGFKIQWPRPKPVKRWINIYPNTGHSTKAAADQAEVIGRIACIEIELPPIKP